MDRMIDRPGTPGNLATSRVKHLRSLPLLPLLESDVSSRIPHEWRQCHLLPSRSQQQRIRGWEKKEQEKFHRGLSSSTPAGFTKMFALAVGGGLFREPSLLGRGLRFVLMNLRSVFSLLFCRDFYAVERVVGVVRNSRTSHVNPETLEKKLVPRRERGSVADDDA